MVTGASYGIGAASAIGLAEDGFDVVITDLRTADLQDTSEKVRAAGRRCLPVALDIRDQDGIDRAFAAANSEFGGIDLLVNNAGVPSPRKPAVDLTRAEWDGTLAVNLTGTFFMCQAMGRYLIDAARPGAIVNIASTHGLVGIAGASAYGVAKAGVAHMVRLLAIEWVGHGIRVNGVAPGATVTPSRAPNMANPESRARGLARIPMGRYGQADEIAGAVRYLASPQAAYITGHILVLDGGLTAA